MSIHVLNNEIIEFQFSNPGNIPYKNFKTQRCQVGNCTANLQLISVILFHILFVYYLVNQFGLIVLFSLCNFVKQSNNHVKPFITESINFFIYATSYLHSLR